MIDTISRHRPLALLATVVLAQVLLLAFQIKRVNNVRLVRYWAVELMTPLERAGTWTFSHVGGVWSGYVGLRNTRAENERLRGELDTLRLRNRELESHAAEAQRLSTLLNFHEAHTEASMLAAEVIGASADPTSHTLFINRGERDHLRRNMGVITPDGVVGKIVEVFPSTAQVLLINDKDSGVGALFASSRTHGVVKGSGDPEPHMEYVINEEKLQPGDAIVTSGEDRIFPEGLADRDRGRSKARKSVPSYLRSPCGASRPPRRRHRPALATGTCAQENRVSRVRRRNIRAIWRTIICSAGAEILRGCDRPKQI